MVVLGLKGADYNQGFDRDGVVRVFDLIDEAWVSRPFYQAKSRRIFRTIIKRKWRCSGWGNYPRDKSWQAGRVYTYDWEGTYWNLRTQHDV